MGAGGGAGVALAQRLLPMAERDCRSFDLVSAAYGMPKDTDQQKALREKAIQEAMIGAMVVLGHADTTLEKTLGFIAVLLGAGNAAGGYVVTERMLEMFKKKDKKAGAK